MEVRLEHCRKDPWSGFIKYPNCFTGICAPLSRAGNRVTGLSVEDEKRLEKALGYPDGHLARTSDFWITYAVRIPKEGLTLHTEIPENEMIYLLAKAHHRVASSKLKITPNTDFVLINRELEAEEANKNSRTKIEAFAEFNKMSPADTRKALRLYGFKADNVSDDIAKSTLFSFIENDPAKYLMLWVNNKSRETQYLIEAAIAKNVIRKQKNLYYYGTEVIGHSLQDAMAHIDDKQNQDIRLVIMQELESK